MTELELHRGAELATRADLRSAATDSWTEVVAEVAKLAGHIADTDFVPKAMRNNPAAVAAAILHGREVGFGPMTALAQTHVIEGRVSISAEAMRALVVQHGHHIRIGEMSGTSVTIAGRRAGEDHWTTVTWTLQDARQADLTNKTNWKKYPRQMLLARATTELLRAAFPDVIHGLMSTEELDELVEAPSAAPAAVEAAAKPRTTQVSRKRAKARQNESSAEVEAPTAPPADVDGARAPQEEPGPVHTPKPDSEPEPDVWCNEHEEWEIAGGQGENAEPETTDLVGALRDSVEAAREARQRELRELAEQPREPLSEHKDAVDVDPYQTVDEPLTPVPAIEEGSTPITGLQRGKIMAELKRIGVDTTDDGRPMRLTYLAALSGRDKVDSLNDLTFRDAHLVINRLVSVETVAELDSKLSGL